MLGDLEIEFGLNDVVPVNKTIQGVQIPELPIDTEFFQLRKANNGAPNCAQIQREAFADDVVGDCPGDLLERTTQVMQLRVDALLKSAGYAGKQLGRLYKMTASLEESMRSLFNANEELFDLSTQQLIEKAIRACDVAAFLQIFNQALGVA